MSVAEASSFETPVLDSITVNKWKSEIPVAKHITILEVTEFVYKHYINAYTLSKFFYRLALSIMLEISFSFQMCIMNLSSTAQDMNFPLRISPVNMTESAVSCGFGHIYWRNP